MAELGDALGSGPSARKGIGVQIPFPALFCCRILILECGFNFVDGER